MTNYLNNVFNNLYNYVKKNNYEGNDLFDGLNSRLFKNTPPFNILYKSRFFRLALIQFCKLSPINFRKILFVPKSFNPKGGALFLLGNLNMYKITGDEKYKNDANALYLKLKELSIKREKGLAWGYNFDWQARAFYVPVGMPNVVTSVYVGKSLIEYYNVFNDEKALNQAKQISEFILNDMIISEDESSICFGYIPGEDTQVHNANLLAAGFLASIDKYINSDEIKYKIKKAVNFSLTDINEDGSWPYGTKPFHRWVDNFHTAFNIESLINIQDDMNLVELNEKIEKIIAYYIDNLFTQDGLPKYYNTRLYPIDIHVIAEVLIVLDKIKKSKLNYNKDRLICVENQVLNCIERFQDKKGYFYFQKNKYFWNKIPYIRWGQAWMFYALSNVIKDKNE